MSICGKGNIKEMIAALLMLGPADFLLLYTKFVKGDSPLSFILYLLAMVLVGIPVIWLITIIVKSNREKDNEKTVRSIVFVPILKAEGKFKLYKSDFYALIE